MVCSRVPRARYTLYVRLGIWPHEHGLGEDSVVQADLLSSFCSCRKSHWDRQAFLPRGSFRNRSAMLRPTNCMIQSRARCWFESIPEQALCQASNEEFRGALRNL